jgi:hypothetical protein
MFMPPFPFATAFSAQMPPVGSSANPSLAASLLPFSFPGYVRPEMVTEMQKAALQNQQQQLSQLKAYIAEYAKSIDDALAKIEEEIEKTTKQESKKA